MNVRAWCDGGHASRGKKRRKNLTWSRVSTYVHGRPHYPIFQILAGLDLLKKNIVFRANQMKVIFWRKFWNQNARSHLRTLLLPFWPTYLRAGVLDKDLKEDLFEMNPERKTSFFTDWAVSCRNDESGGYIYFFSVQKVKNGWRDHPFVLTNKE